jgi:hypothetical protein
LLHLPFATANPRPSLRDVHDLTIAPHPASQNQAPKTCQWAKHHFQDGTAAAVNGGF